MGRENLSLAEALQRGYAAHQAGQLGEAERIYKMIIRAVPNQFDALHLLGVLEAQRGNNNEANRHLGRALNVHPRSAEALNNRANVLRALERPAEALTSCDRALAVKPDFAEALNNRGNALHDLGRLSEALESYDKALAVRPDYANALANRADVLRDLGRHHEALASCDQALALNPQLPEALNNRGNVLRELGQHEEALASYERALALRARYGRALVNRAIALSALGRLAEALESCRRALDLEPSSAEALCAQGTTLRELRRYEDAEASFEQALRAEPDSVAAHCCLGGLLLERGSREEAIAHYRRVSALQPGSAEAECALCMAELPIIFRDQAEVSRQRAAYEQALRRLDAEVANGKLIGDLESALGANLPFYLAYQGCNDRELQSIWGGLVCRAMAPRQSRALALSPPSSGERLRVGIVTRYFRGHSVWKLPLRGWLTRLDRQKFALYGYHTASEKDAETEVARGLCDRFVKGPLSNQRWREEILSDRPHVLIYPEIGMDSASALLAAQRLALVQCASWGHPETTGMPTIDYFLSSDLMEPPEGQTHYTERLVRLPNLSVYCEPLQLDTVPIDRTQLGLRADAVAFWCGQSIYKYLPRYDQIFPRIAVELRDCQFVFIRHNVSAEITSLFRERLEKAFASFGLRAMDHCVFLERLNPSEFVAAIGQCDVFLDSVDWSGCNSTLESLEHAIPIVTVRGPLMRGRHSAAMLERIGVTETVAASVDAYVEIAVRLGSDAAWRHEIHDRMVRQKHRIYRDESCIAALEEFLHKAAYGMLEGPAASTQVQG